MTGRAGSDDKKWGMRTCPRFRHDSVKSPSPHTIFLLFVAFTLALLFFVELISLP